MRSLVSGCANRLQFVEWALSLIRLWLVVLMIFVPSLPYYILQARQHCRSKVLWLDRCLFLFLVAFRVPFHTKDTRAWGWRFYVGTNFNSPCSMCCVGVVLTNESPLSVCREQPPVLVTAWVVWRFPWDCLANNSVLWKLQLVTRPVETLQRLFLK